MFPVVKMIDFLCVSFKKSFPWKKFQEECVLPSDTYLRLPLADMHLFGHYPAHDDFYLVVCSACNQVVKPQVFQSHCGKWTPAPGGCTGSQGPWAPSWVALCLFQSKACGYTGPGLLPLHTEDLVGAQSSLSPPAHRLLPVRANRRKPVACLGRRD